MRAPISVIIPTYNAAQDLPACLSALGEGLSAGLIRELIISDGRSDDDTKTIAEAAGATWLTGPAGRGGQLRRAAEAAEGAWLLALHADTCLERGWSDAVLSCLADPETAYYSHLRFDAGGFAPRVVAGWANLRSAMFRLPYGDQTLLIARDVYEAVGGYDDIPLMEDVAIARRLGPRLKPSGATAVTSADKFQRRGWINRGSRNLWLLGRYLAGADPAELARVYRK